MAIDGCDPCAGCIPGTILNDTFKQQILVVICNLITAIESGALGQAKPVLNEEE